MPITREDFVWGCARFNGATGALFNGRGLTCVRNAQGRYTFTLTDQIDPLERVIQVTPESAAANVRAVSLVQVDDSTFTVAINDQAAAAQDADMNVSVFRVGP